MNIWVFNALLTRRLFGWNVINMATGVALGRNSDTLWRGIGSQQLVGQLSISSRNGYAKTSCKRRAGGRDNGESREICDVCYGSMRDWMWFIC